MKKLLYPAALLIAAAFATSCSNDDDVISESAQNKLSVNQNAPAATTNRGVPVNSHKLIFENNTPANILLNDIFASGGPNMPGAGNHIHFKGTQTESVTVAPYQTVTYETIATVSPSAMGIPYWRVQSEASHADLMDTAPKILNDWGMQVPGANSTVKCSYWTGILVTAMHGTTPYATATGDVDAANAAYLGATTGFNSTITYSEGTMPPITVSWVQQSNGDIKVVCN